MIVISYIAALLGFSVGSGIIIYHTATTYYKAEKFQKFKRQKPAKKMKREKIDNEIKSEEKGYRHLKDLINRFKK